MLLTKILRVLLSLPAYTMMTKSVTVGSTTALPRSAEWGRALRFALVLSLALLAAPLTQAAAPAPYLDPGQPVEQRVAGLISRLTLEQKAALLNHKGTTATVDGRPIRSEQWNQCLNGVQWNRPTTLFPTCVAMAATWNTDLVQNEIAKVLSDEACAIYNGWHLDPKAPLVPSHRVV
jgi:hypothetical protein